MIWRSSYHRRIAQLADFGTAFISYVLAYFISILLHRLEPSLFPPNTEIRTSYVLATIVLSIVYEILFDQQKAYSSEKLVGSKEKVRHGEGLKESCGIDELRI